MKTLRVVLTIYVLWLTVLPCTDDAYTQSDEHATSIEASHHNECSEDLCSPFCNCTCCGLQTLTIESAAVREQQLSAAEFTIAKSVSIPKNSGHAFWQPPKI